MATTTTAATDRLASLLADHPAPDALLEALAPLLPPGVHRALAGSVDARRRHPSRRRRRPGYMHLITGPRSAACGALMMDGNLGIRDDVAPGLAAKLVTCPGCRKELP